MNIDFRLYKVKFVFAFVYDVQHAVRALPFGCGVGRLPFWSCCVLGSCAAQKCTNSIIRVEQLS